MSLRICAMSDLHYARHPDPNHPELMSEKALSLLEKVLAEMRGREKRPDIYLLLGDTLRDSNEPDAVSLLSEIREVFAKEDAPFLYVIGNHDPDPRLMADALGEQAPYTTIKGYRLVGFNDRQIEAGYCAFREEREFELMRLAAEDFPGRLIAFQHVPLHSASHTSRTECVYLNADKIVDSMNRHGYILSLSGHEHNGEAPYRDGAITFFTLPSLTLPPFHATLVDIDDAGAINISSFTLAGR